MKNRGFTLIELLVAMAIIGILATVGLGAFFSSQLKGRDARRKQDLGQIQKALEMYYNDKGSYPTDITFGTEWKDAVSEELYMKKVPNDPQSGAKYDYEPEALNGTWYNLYARLENTKDFCFTSNPDDCKVHSDTDCGTGECNYKVSSTNAP